MINFINKLKRYINKTYFRTPGLEFFKKHSDIKVRSKYLKFWLKKVKNKRSFKRYFLNDKNLSDKSQIRFTQNDNYKITNEMLNSLAINGVIVIENALPQKEFTLIKDYFEDLKNGKYLKKWNKKPDNPLFFSQADEVRGLIDIENFLFLKEYSDNFSKEVYGKLVKPTVEFHYLNIKNQTENATRGATYLHTDRFLPHFKIFYTPNEITNDSAPFQYSLGSHKLNSDYLNFFQNAKIFDETDKFSKPLLKKLETITTKENTLYVAFTNGLHKRTCFKEKNKDRSMVFLQYVEKYNKLNYLL
jgi:hypothetical protein